MGTREGYHWSPRRRRPTAAQRRILDGLARGWSNRLLAEQLGLSAETVKWHVAQLLAETGCRDREELVQWWSVERRTFVGIVGAVSVAMLPRLALAAAALLLTGVTGSLALGLMMGRPLPTRAPRTTPRPSATAGRAPASGLSGGIPCSDGPTLGTVAGATYEGCIVIEIGVGIAYLHLPGAGDRRRMLDYRARALDALGDAGAVKATPDDWPAETPVLETGTAASAPSPSFHGRAVVEFWSTMTRVAVTAMGQDPGDVVAAAHKLIGAQALPTPASAGP